MDIIGNMYPIPDKEIEKYINRILEDFKDEQFGDFANNEYTYTDKIKQKIKSLSETFAEKKFKDFLGTDKVTRRNCERHHKIALRERREHERLWRTCNQWNW